MFVESHAFAREKESGGMNVEGEKEGGECGERFHDSERTLWCCDSMTDSMRRSGASQISATVT